MGDDVVYTKYNSSLDVLASTPERVSDSAGRLYPPNSDGGVFGKVLITRKKK